MIILQPLSFFLKNWKFSYCYIGNFENHVNLVQYNLKLGNIEKLKCFIYLWEAYQK